MPHLFKVRKTFGGKAPAELIRPIEDEMSDFLYGFFMARRMGPRKTAEFRASLARYLERKAKDFDFHAQYQEVKAMRAYDDEKNRKRVQKEL